jgi:hypothetical protein
MLNAAGVSQNPPAKKIPKTQSGKQIKRRLTQGQLSTVNLSAFSINCLILPQFGHRVSLI